MATVPVIGYGNGGQLYCFSYSQRLGRVQARTVAGPGSFWNSSDAKPFRSPGPFPGGQMALEAHRNRLN